MVVAKLSVGCVVLRNDRANVHDSCLCTTVAACLDTHRNADTVAPCTGKHLLAAVEAADVQLTLMAPMR